MKPSVMYIAMLSGMIFSACVGDPERTHPGGAVSSFQNVDVSGQHETPYDDRQREREAELRSSGQAPHAVPSQPSAVPDAGMTSDPRY
jgi:hypothetical protein